MFSKDRGDIGGVSREICFIGLEGVEEKDFWSNAETMKIRMTRCSRDKLNTGVIREDQKMLINETVWLMHQDE